MSNRQFVQSKLSELLPLPPSSIRPPSTASRPAGSPSRWSTFASRSSSFRWCDATPQAVLGVERFVLSAGRNWKENFRSVYVRNFLIKKCPAQCDSQFSFLVVSLALETFVGLVAAVVARLGVGRANYRQAHRRWARVSRLWAHWWQWRWRSSFHRLVLRTDRHVLHLVLELWASLLVLHDLRLQTTHERWLIRLSLLVCIQPPTIACRLFSESLTQFLVLPQQSTWLVGRWTAHPDAGSWPLKATFGKRPRERLLLIQTQAPTVTNARG